MVNVQRPRALDLDKGQQPGDALLFYHLKGLAA